MIRINLLGEKVDHSAAYALQLLAFFGSVAVALLSIFFVQDGLTSELDSLMSEKVMLEKKLARLEKVTKEVEELEKKRKVLKEKLSTIATLKTKKHGPVHILDDLNLAVPERAWLVGTEEKGGILTIKGIALDNQTIAQFMANLKTYPYFGNVDLVLSSEYLQEEVKLKQFTLSVTLRNPLTEKKPEVTEVKSGEKGDSSEKKPKGA